MGTLCIDGNDLPLLDNWQRAAIFPPDEKALWIPGSIGDRVLDLRSVLHIRPYGNQNRKRPPALHVHVPCGSNAGFSPALAPPRLSRCTPCHPNRGTCYPSEL